MAFRSNFSFVSNMAITLMVTLPVFTTGCGETQSPRLPIEIQQAWETKGATVGTMYIDGSNGFQPIGGSDHGDIPAFQFSTLEPDILARLPIPENEFGLDLSIKYLSDKDVQDLDRFRTLRVVSLEGTRVTWNFIDDFKAQRPSCEVLYFPGPQLPPDEMIQIAAKVSADAGYLKHINGIDVFELDGYPNDGVIPSLRFEKWPEGSLSMLTDPGFPFGLDFAETNLRDEDLSKIPNLDNLQILDLYSTHVTDEGMKKVAQFSSLQRLTLRETDVGDVGLRELHALKNLKSINLTGTDVTEPGIEKFRSALPNCEVY